MVSLLPLSTGNRPPRRWFRSALKPQPLKLDPPGIERIVAELFPPD
jgi:hypothetical protein